MDPKPSMPVEIADHIRLLRTGRRGHSYRKISELICDIYPDYIKSMYGDLELYGNQMHGQYLVEEAAKVLCVSNEEYQEHWL